MAITNASRLADFGSGIGTEGAVLQVDNTNNRLGVGTTNPQAMLQVGTAVTVYGNSGIVSATTFKGALTGNADTATTATTATTASGLTGSPNITINNLVGVAATFSGVLSYEDVTNIDSVGVVTAGKGFRATTGGLIVTAGVSTFPQSTTITAKTGGQVLVGSSAEATIGSYTWNGLQVRSTTGGAAIVFEEFNTSNWMAGLKFGKSRASSIGSYTIVQNGDNLGNLIWHGADGTDMACQAASIQVEVDGAPGSNDMPGRMIFATTADGGVSPTERMRITASGGLLLSNGILVERCKIVSTAWSTTNDISLDDGNVFLNTANLGGTNNYLDITSSNGISNDLEVGDMTSVTCITAVNDAAAYIDAITVGGANVTESWVGGSVPTDGGSSGYDVYTFNIIKTSATPTYVVIANQVKGS